ncbi:MAG: phosphatidylcholine/phosphatidylserine synthase [Rhodospirillaceae bacterium]|jgi:CDP-diacylglycerol---serine O-phosphatidyltransferase|nr:phosphatidylcholine/phosphatidylserine synthase [Rhodospirillaceae bacterium]MBT5563487.1 phosphatidylcholine/phosphatidylserine synthase [Rhodospirillaceae bacterium]MBT6240782.1 phosphatidylcholine/phosphatidylserine synthase [Rhodospirillaceae bacterium]MBT7137788.1 phosphatidylcholine/phosphatidylserine synthase [Rhodospirillaceae bacterium]
MAGRRKRPEWLHINKMIPNFLTILAISAGMSAIRFGLDDRWEPAALAILAAAILDALDGRIARILKGASKFGAELDSLADFLSFGVAPAMMLYLWAMQDAGRFGWMLALLFTISMALRLARFNTMLEDEDLPSWTKNFFSGTPAPAAAGLVLTPMILSFQFGDDFFRQPMVVSFFLIGVAALVVSSIPTFSFKKIKVPSNQVLPAMIISGAFVTALVSAPWTTLSCVLLVYLATIPFSVRMYRQKMAESPLSEEDPGDSETP